ncbi:MAG: hypothetical protein AAFV43_00065 [Planctomycetota bacterium]
MLVVAATGLVVGCGEVDPNQRFAELNSTNIQRLVTLYGAFQSRNELWGPRDDAAFKQFVQGVSPKKLERIGVDASSIDQIFVSGRDGEPFNVRYGVRGAVKGSNEPVVFEASGVDGKRMVGFLNATQREVDAAEYERLWEQGAAGANPRT